MNGVQEAAPIRRLGPPSVLSAYAVLLFAVPSAYTLGSYAITAAMLVGLIAGALWCGGLLLPGYGITMGSSPGQLAILVYVSLILVSYLVAVIWPANSLSTGAADRHLIGLMAVAGAGLLAADGLRDRMSLYRVLGFVVAAGGAIALIGILQYMAGVDLAQSLKLPGFGATADQAFIYSRAGLDRVAGTARHPIEFGIVCASLLPIALHLAVHASSVAGRRASLLVTCLLGVALPMSLSRSAVVAAAVGLAIVLPGMPAGRRWRLIAGIGAIMWIVALLAPGVLTTIRELFFGEAAAPSTEARTTAWQEALDLFGERMWFGQGFGVFQGSIVDNQLFLTLVESGIVGIVALVVLANGAVQCLLGIRRATVDPQMRNLGLTMLAVVGAVTAGSTGLATLRYPTTSGLLFLALGLAGAAHQIATAGVVERRQPIGSAELVPVRS